MANTRLQAAIEASAGDSEQARVEHTQDAPSQAALRGPQRAEAIIRAEKKLERVERDFRALSASRREEAEQLRASISDKDATIADLRTALEDSNNKGQLILEQLQERELATAQREAQLQAQYEDMRTQHDDMTQQAKEFANKGQEVWDQLQQAQNKLHVAQATMEYERQVAKSSEQALKDVRQQLDATAKKAKEEQDKWKKEKEGLEDKLKVARGDTERIHKDREVWRTLCNDKEADIKQLEEKLKVKSGDRQADALVASKDAIVAQKNMRPLRALCHWASVDAFLEGVEDIKNLTSKSLYNRTSLLLDLSWKVGLV